MSAIRLLLCSTALLPMGSALAQTAPPKERLQIEPIPVTATPPHPMLEVVVTRKPVVVEIDADLDETFVPRIIAGAEAL